MEESLSALLDSGVREFVEIGPGKTLSGFLKKVAKAKEIEEFTVHSLEKKEDVEAFLSSL